MITQKLISALTEQLDTETLSALMEVIESMQNSIQKKASQLAECDSMLSQDEQRMNELISYMDGLTPEQIEKIKSMRKEMESTESRTQSMLEEIRSTKAEAARIQSENERESRSLFDKKEQIREEQKKLNEYREKTYSDARKEAQENLEISEYKMREKFMTKIEDMKYFCIDWMRERRCLYVGSIAAVILMTIFLIIYIPAARTDAVRFGNFFLETVLGVYHAAGNAAASIKTGNPVGDLIIAMFVAGTIFSVPFIALTLFTWWVIKTCVLPVADFRMLTLVLISLVVIPLAPVLHLFPFHVNCIWLHLVMQVLYCIWRKIKNLNSDDQDNHPDLELDGWEANFIREYRRKYRY